MYFQYRYFANKLQSCLLEMLSAKFGSYWPSGSGEEDFLNVVNIFSLLRMFSPLGKRYSPSFEQTGIPLEQTGIPFIQGSFVPSLVENDKW